MRKNTISQRLHIVKGQIDGLINLIEKKRRKTIEFLLKEII